MASSAAKSADKLNKLSNSNYMVVLLLITLLALGGTGLGAKMLIDTILHDTKVVTAKDKAAKLLQTKRECHMLGNLGTFHQRNLSPLAALYRLLDAPWSTSPQVNAQTAQRLWLGPEHGQIVASYPEWLLQAAMPLFGKMGILGATLPQEGETVEETNIIGGTINANEKRYRLVQQCEDKLGCNLGPVIGWYGQRLRETRDGTIEQIVARLVARDPELLNHPWVLEQLNLDANDPNPWLQPFATEYQLGIAGALLVFGLDIRVMETHEINEVSEIPGVPARTVLWQRLTRPNGSDLIMLNAAAQVRTMNGRPAEPRHVTASCAQEWLTHFPPAKGARVAIISGNPHTERTIGDVAQTIRLLNRDDLHIIPLGTHEAQTAHLPRTCLGEVARLLKNEVL